MSVINNTTELLPLKLYYFSMCSFLFYSEEGGISSVRNICTYKLHIVHLRAIYMQYIYLLLIAVVQLVINIYITH
jgi:hypothetical protein